MPKGWMAGFPGIAGVALLAGCAPKNLSYSRDVAPILSNNCSECHAPGKPGFLAKVSIRPVATS